MNWWILRRAEAVTGTVYGIGRTIVSGSSCACCAYGNITSSMIWKGHAMVTSDCSLVLEIEITIGFGSLSCKHWFDVLLFVQVKWILTMKADIYRHALILHVIIRWQIDVLSITWDSHSTHSNINSCTWAWFVPVRTVMASTTNGTKNHTVILLGVFELMTPHFHNYLNLFWYTCFN